ncbi:diacylglycerol kinase family protein [Candidatus Margulisiibacteriota bacterium]
MPRRLVQSFKYAGKGIKHAFKTQRNLWLHLFTSFIVIVVGIYMKLSYFELGVIVIAILFVLVTEMINTSIEEIVNLVTPTRRAGATIAKDVAAGAVLFAAFCAIIVGCLVFIPHLAELIR